VSSRALVENLVRLAGSLDLDVVAEGVETKEQADQLRAIGCPSLQGFLIARPMPVTDFAVSSRQVRPLAS
jgi:EAL domain-containing protein (putative c-di-GMP-specific phosphodiesterase class I)